MLEAKAEHAKAKREVTRTRYSEQTITNALIKVNAILASWSISLFKYSMDGFI